MIFVTLGTTDYPFTRLLKNLDETIESISSTEEIIIQSKVTNYKFNYPNLSIVADLPFNQVVDNIRNSRLTICHGGASSIFLALQYSPNMPIIIPRLSCHKEHINDHQLIYVNFLKKKYNFPTRISIKNITHPISNHYSGHIHCSPKLIDGLVDFSLHQF